MKKQLEHDISENDRRPRRRLSILTQKRKGEKEEEKIWEREDYNLLTGFTFS